MRKGVETTKIKVGTIIIPDFVTIWPVVVGILFPNF